MVVTCFSVAIDRLPRQPANIRCGPKHLILPPSLKPNFKPPCWLCATRLAPLALKLHANHRPCGALYSACQEYNIPIYLPRDADFPSNMRVRSLHQAMSMTHEACLSPSSVQGCNQQIRYGQLEPDETMRAQPAGLRADPPHVKPARIVRFPSTVAKLQSNTGIKCGSACVPTAVWSAKPIKTAETLHRTDCAIRAECDVGAAAV
ncbi:hypothetical protein CTAM01_15303 [Colletotrichum tamarilloi]|uniref:Uncharacterized protein n=1 Tax=Colletotrichum tamarilloi TaxID=1209934 RepID=A0ABQ9QM02_9PEZI|nr:uncharacterized protein CTAM01_15303 [Colletotrichum tamarilloi]KAK1476952.1 hypothetical protein CTAM01_15303 [Colletotrichum tamarilloi]